MKAPWLVQETRRKVGEDSASETYNQHVTGKASSSTGRMRAHKYDQSSVVKCQVLLPFQMSTELETRWPKSRGFKIDLVDDGWEAVAQFITPLKATGDRQAEQPVVSLQTFLSIFSLALVEVKEVDRALISVTNSWTAAVGSLGIQWPNTGNGSANTRQPNRETSW
ncbi:hypothetical protein Anapl_00873 [Anas platyrhynchos]|uniref:Uncharacterized protein n=1 Tax=Anas platyrhynchos TaxID=8839 RepID=R0JYY8_ANAPL|nr:hypothetical protein Anapl_00873 [Anas platyrhynchos]